MSAVTVVRPEGDSVEYALSAWAALALTAVIGAARVKVTDLRGSAVTRSAVEQQLGLSDAIIYFGHGEKDRWGFPNALVDSINVSKASNRILISIACKAAASLGKDCISKGVKSFVGFDDELVVYLAQPSIFGTVVEKALVPFIISGSSINDFRNDLIDGFKTLENIYHRGPGRNNPNAVIIWLAAHINWRGIVLFGDSSAFIV